MAHEELFDDIDEELRKLIRLAQHLPCGVDLDSWEEMREFLAHGDDVFFAASFVVAFTALQKMRLH